MARKHPAIPKTIDLPFGYHIEVKYLTKEAFHEKNGNCDAAWWHEDESEGEGGTIDLIKETPPLKQWGNFLHELEHSLVDYREYLRSRV